MNLAIVIKQILFLFSVVATLRGSFAAADKAVQLDVGTNNRNPIKGDMLLRGDAASYSASGDYHAGTLLADSQELHPPLPPSNEIVNPFFFDELILDGELPPSRKLQVNLWDMCGQHPQKATEICFVWATACLPYVIGTCTCDQGLGCEFFNQDACGSGGVCVGPGKMGESCVEMADVLPCEEGLSCRVDTGKCVGPGKLGELCSDDLPCEKDFSCDAGEKKCYNDPRLENEPCSSEANCNEDLICDDEDQKCISPSGTCITSTQAIMDEVHGSYDDSGATWEEMLTTKDEQSTITIIDDFTTNQVKNIIYKNACEKADGEYTELTYEATCNSAEGDEIALQVIGQPRCYAEACAAAIENDKDFGDELLKEFSLVPTAKRANDQHNSTSSGWACTGELNDALKGNTNGGSGGSGGGCAYATDKMYTEIDDIISAQLGMKPKVTDKKFLFFLPTEVKKVEYSASPSALASACSGLEGMFVEKEFTMTCTVGGGSTKSDRASFEVVDYSVCLASICSVNAAAKEETIYIQFKDQMLDENYLDEARDWSCLGSGAMATSIKVAVGAAFALWWHLRM